MIHIITDGKRGLLLVAIHAAGGSIDQVLYRIMPASFQNIEKANHIAVDVSTRVFDGIAHTRLRGKVNDNFRSVVREQPVHSLLISQISLDEGEAWILLQLLQPALFQ